jgi:hypothetical protein
MTRQSGSARRAAVGIYADTPSRDDLGMHVGITVMRACTTAAFLAVMVPTSGSEGRCHGSAVTTQQLHSDTSLCVVSSHALCALCALKQRIKSSHAEPGRPTR